MNIFVHQPVFAKTVLVTGAGSEIGHGLADEGAAVFVFEMLPEAAADTLNKIAALSGKAQTVACHISDTERSAGRLRFYGNCMCCSGWKWNCANLCR